MFQSSNLVSRKLDAQRPAQKKFFCHKLNRQSRSTIIDHFVENSKSQKREQSAQTEKRTCFSFRLFASNQRENFKKWTNHGSQTIKLEKLELLRATTKNKCNKAVERKVPEICHGINSGPFHYEGLLVQHKKLP